MIEIDFYLYERASRQNGLIEMTRFLNAKTDVNDNFSDFFDPLID